MVGDLVSPTGFAQVLHNIIKPNIEEFDITGLGVNYRGDPHKIGIDIFPAMISGRGNVYGVDRLIDILKTNKIDLLFILNDSWVISYYLEAIKKELEGIAQLPKIVVYFPVDSEYHNPIWYRDFDIVSRAYTYTEFGVKVLEKAMPTMKVGIMPHGTDTEDFFKLNEDRTIAKKKLLGDKMINELGEPDDLFFVLNANRNQPRKRLDITIEGFSIFAKDKPSGVKLYMHSGVVDSSVDLRVISKRYGVDDRLIITSLNSGIQRVPIQRLNLIYNACDVGINTSMGEGWGLINTEHAVTGAPQIVPEHSACTELFEDCGLLMPTVTRYTFDGSQTVGKLVSPEAVAESLETLYADKNLRKELSDKALKKFTSKEYRWQYIAEQWKDIFKEVCDDSTVSDDN